MRAPRLRSGVIALLAAAIAMTPGWVRAETGAPLPQGYTSDIPTAGSAPAGTPALPVQKVDDDDSDTDEATDEYADNDPSALTDFNEPLAPYGSWVVDATYGTIWVPNASVVGADFAPYQTAGHWALTDDDEWMWVSDYDWGYIPFHYGRWLWINGQGWAWIPGRTYAPAWVSWRVGDGGYLGWAPMPPTWYWSGGVATNLWVTPYAAYCFVPTTHIFHERVYSYVVRDAVTVRTIAAGTRAYKPARPSVTVTTRPGSGRSRHFTVAAPSLAEAGIRGSSGPKVRIGHDARARAFATPTATAATRRAIASGNGFHAGGAVSARGPSRALPSRGSDLHAGSADRAPAGRESRFVGPAPRISREARSFEPAAPAVRPAPFSRSAPAARPAPFSSPAPAARSAPAARPAPFSRSAPAARPTFTPSAPRVAPSLPPRVSSPTHAAPSHAPSRTFSAPSSGSSHSGGGHSGGGHSGGGRHR